MFSSPIVSRLGIVIAATGVFLSAPAHASGRNLRGTLVHTSVVPQEQTAKVGSKTIYLNRCTGGCDVTGGWPDDSRTNRSSIVMGDATLSEFAYDDATWNAIVACVQDIYAPFDIQVTEVDPGDAPHYEAMVAGDPEELAAPADVGGVAPFTCAVIDNAITYTFANAFGGDVQRTCEVVAQETAHAFGLDHVVDCTDPMSYLGGCGAKRFRDTEAMCGEYSARPCHCGGSTQSSHATLLALFGPNTLTDPLVAITEPRHGALVHPGFGIQVDDLEIALVVLTELYIDGVLVDHSDKPSPGYVAPHSVRVGQHRVTVRAYDSSGRTSEDTIDVTLAESCLSDLDCSRSQICATAIGGGICSEPCNELDGSCPDGYQCIATEQGGVCWPGGHTTGGDPTNADGTLDRTIVGGCSAAGSAPIPAWPLVVLLLAYRPLTRRRR